MALERAGRTGRAASRGLRCLASPAGLRGCGTEVAWLAAHAALYPLGFRAERAADADPHRLDDLSPRQRELVVHDVAAAATPILLVHGMGDNRSVFTLLRRSLRRRGFGRVRTVNYSVFTSDVLAVWSDLDQVIYPKRHARIDHPELDARNVLLRGVGHTSLPADSRVVREVARTLAHLDQNGSAVEAPQPPRPRSAPERVLAAPDRVRKGIGRAPFG